MRRALIALALLAGCDDEPVEPVDAAPDVIADAMPDVMRDAARDAMADMRPDIAPADGGDPLDAASDGAVDAFADGMTDVMPDGGEIPSDAALDGMADGMSDGMSDAMPDATPIPDMAWPPAAHRVFMTAQAFPASFEGLAGADAACAAAAADAGLDGVWRAILSDAATAARDRIVIVGPIETTAGEPVARDADDLWDGTIRTPISVDATGLPPGGRPDVWSGTDADGTSDARANTFCSDWGRADRPLGGVEIGRGDLADARWIALYRDGASAFACSSMARLYCIDGQ